MCQAAVRTVNELVASTESVAKGRVGPWQPEWVRGSVACEADYGASR